ncbi:MAG: mycothiol synthase [Actinomycetota bacterium]|nr:mycothiol synthase [Actinomycetota bacterium]
MDVRRIDPAAFDWSATTGAAAEVRRIAVAAGQADGADVLNEQAELELKYHSLSDARLWLAGGGFALLHRDVLDLAVHPEGRRLGVGNALARAALAEVRREVSAWSHADHPAAVRIAATVGLERARELRVMRRPTSLPVAAVAVPPGVRLRTFEPAYEEALLAVNAAAFAQHPEQGKMSVKNFRERTSEPWFDASGLFLAVPARACTGDEAPELLGFHWTKVHRDVTPAYGEVYVVAVNPKAAGRGLGTTLTAAGLRHLADTGVGEVILYVDADNDPAIAVYAGLGFEVVRTEAQYRGIPA